MAREYILVNYYLCSIYLWVLCGDGMKVLDLFSGIGGFSLGLERAGMETVAFCEIEDFPRKVLAKHWPGVPIYDDVRKLDGKQFRGTVDVVCGGFPCQDVSVAGKGKGFGGERTSLYAEMLRIIGECQPGYAIFENVTGLLSGEQGRWFAKFLYDLAEIGYDAEWHCISASELGANHHRDRVWIISYPSKLQRNGRDTINENSSKEIPQPRDANSEHDISNPDLQRPEQTEKARNNGEDRQKSNDKFTGRLYQSLRESKTVAGKFKAFGLLDSIEPTVRRGVDGIPGRAHRLKGIGNAVVPQIPE